MTLVRPTENEKDI